MKEGLTQEVQNMTVSMTVLLGGAYMGEGDKLNLLSSRRRPAVKLRQTVAVH